MNSGLAVVRPLPSSPWSARGGLNLLLHCRGLEPDSSRGADVLLTPIDGGYLFEAVTPKGEALLALSNGKVPACTRGRDPAAAQARSSAGKVAKNSPPYLPSCPRGWPRTSTMSSGRHWRCGAMAAVHCGGVVRPATASISSTITIVTTEARGDAIGTPARPGSSRSMPPVTIPGRRRANVTGNDDAQVFDLSQPA